MRCASSFNQSRFGRLDFVRGDAEEEFSLLAHTPRRRTVALPGAIGAAAVVLAILRDGF